MDLETRKCDVVNLRGHRLWVTNCAVFAFGAASKMTSIKWSRNGDRGTSTGWKRYFNSAGALACHGANAAA